MDTVTLIRVAAGCLFLCVLAVEIIYVAFLSSVLRKCSPASRTMQPGMVWLLFIPLVSLVWRFLVVNALADSLTNEFKLRNLPPNEVNFGRPVGIAMAICAACSIIPFLNFLTIPALFVLWIIFWIKMAGFSQQLDLDSVRGGRPINPLAS